MLTFYRNQNDSSHTPYLPFLGLEQMHKTPYRVIRDDVLAEGLMNKKQPLAIHGTHEILDANRQQFHDAMPKIHGGSS
jgi:hypothetical protein